MVPSVSCDRTLSLGCDPTRMNQAQVITLLADQAFSIRSEPLVIGSWELTLLLREILPGMLILTAFRPFTGMHMRGSILLKSVPASLKMNMGRLTTTQVRTDFLRSSDLLFLRKRPLRENGCYNSSPRTPIRSSHVVALTVARCSLFYVKLCRARCASPKGKACNGPASRVGVWPV